MEGTLFVDPFSPEYYGDRLFDAESPLNRDDCLAPLRQLRAELERRKIAVKTADALWRGDGPRTGRSYYLSLGMTQHLHRVGTTPSLVPLGLFLFESPTVAPRRFLLLRRYQRAARTVFTLLSPAERLGPLRIGGCQFRYPQAPVPDAHRAPVAVRDRWLVAIFANKRPRLPFRDLYSHRRRAVGFFADRGEIDLYGPGWDRVPRVVGAWRGLARSKFEVLRRYRFALCYENSRWRGYVTEKLFDSLHAGTIPIYWGAPDIQDLVPAEVFIDRRDCNSDAELGQLLRDLPESRVNGYREAGQAFLRSEAYRRFSAEAFVKLVLGLVPN